MTPQQKSKKAKYAVFASQYRKAFELFCQEHQVKPDFTNVDLLRLFWIQKNTAKMVNKEIKLSRRADKRLKREMLSNRVRPNDVKYNKGFGLINGDCLRGQEPVSDKTQIREPEYIVIQ